MWSASGAFDETLHVSGSNDVKPPPACGSFSGPAAVAAASARRKGKEVSSRCRYSQLPKADLLTFWCSNFGLSLVKAPKG